MNRFLATIGVLAAVSSGCDDASMASQEPPVVAASAAGSSLDWSTAPALHRAATCDDVAAALRGAAVSWSTLELERARRHVDALGVALEPEPETRPEVTAQFFVEEELSGSLGRPSQRRQRVTIDDGVLVTTTDVGLAFVTTLAAGPAATDANGDGSGTGTGTSIDPVNAPDLTELASFRTDGVPWTVHVSSSDGTLWVISRSPSNADPATPSAPWITVTQLDTSRVAEGGAPRLLRQERIEGRLRAASVSTDGWRIVTEGDLTLEGVSTWPAELAPHADASARDAAFDAVAAANLASIRSQSIAQLVPPSVAGSCADAHYPEHYSGAAWTLVTELDTSTTPTQRLLVGSYSLFATTGPEMAFGASNWPYFWFMQEGQPLETAVHRLDNTQDVHSSRVPGAPLAWGGASFHDGVLVVATTDGDAFLGANFKPQGSTSVTAFDAQMQEVSRLEDVGGAKGVSRIVHGPGVLAVVPETPTAPLRLFGVAPSGGLRAGGSLASLSTWDTVLPLDEQRLLVVGRPSEPGSMAVRIAVYTITDVEKPVLAGQQAVAKGNASEVSVDASGVARYSDVGAAGEDVELVGVPVQVTEHSDVTGYWELEPRLAMFQLSADGSLVALGEVSHGPLAKRDLVPLTCGANANDRRITGAAVADGILYSVSTLGVLAHGLETLSEEPLGDALLSAAASCPAPTP